MTRFYTSDLHLGHANILRYEPGRAALGSTPDEMNEELIRRWNAVVSPADHVTVLGDWAMGTLDDSLALTPRFNGTKTLIVGNHDRPFSGTPVDRYLDAGFASVLHGIVLLSRSVLPAPLDRGSLDVSACHFPYAHSIGDYDDRHADYYPADAGELLLHGHVHSAWRFKTRQINVGCDAWDYRPQTLTALLGHYETWRRCSST